MICHMHLIHLSIENKLASLETRETHLVIQAG